MWIQYINQNIARQDFDTIIKTMSNYIKTFSRHLPKVVTTFYKISMRYRKFIFKICLEFVQNFFEMVSGDILEKLV